MTPIDDVLKGIFPSGQALSELDPNSEAAEQGHSVESLYTQLVNAMTICVSGRIANLGTLLWELMNQRLATSAMYAGVPTVSFVTVGKDGVQHAMVLLPTNWTAMFDAEPIMQWGAVIFTGSQVVDHYNGRFTSESHGYIRERAAAYEAEMLVTAAPRDLNSYQRALLKKFPNGFDVKYAYPYRDVASSRA